MFYVGDMVVVSEDIIHATDQCMTQGALNAIAGQVGKVIDYCDEHRPTIEFDDIGRGPYWVWDKYLEHENARCSFDPSADINSLFGEL